MRRYRWVILILLLMLGYWLLPISGNLRIEREQANSTVMPRIWFDNGFIYVRDSVAWTDVALSVNDYTISRDQTLDPQREQWTWRWRVTSNQLPATVRFYHDCASGCQQRAQLTLGDAPTPMPQTLRSTKLGAIFANPQRDWHDRAAWAIEIAYSQRANEQQWSVDELSNRVAALHDHGLHVLIRISYDQGQSLPPRDNETAFKAYMDFCARLVRDQRFAEVYGFIIGNGYNAQGENTLGAEVTPEWAARVFNGYGLDPQRTDNIMQTMRHLRPTAQLFVGSVAAWNSDQTGALADPLNVAWLNYFNTLLHHLDETNRAKLALGMNDSAPSGFAVQAFGRITSDLSDPALEPTLDLRLPEYGDAQAGFRIYRDWQAIINRYSSTNAKPVIITTNTFVASDGVEPIQNYPAGWLTTAYNEILNDPQIVGLCWFVDVPFGQRWQGFSLSQPAGNLYTAAAEFDQLLRR